MTKRVIEKAELVPWSSIVGQSISLLGKQGEVLAILAVMPQNTDTPKEQAQLLANEIVTCINVGGFFD